MVFFFFCPAHGPVVAHAEQGRLEHVDVSFLHQVGEELEEECEQQQAYVHAVDVGISGDDHIVVAQAFETLLDVERSLEEVEFLVFIYHFAGHAVGVEGFAAEREHGLCLHVADFCD